MSSLILMLPMLLLIIATIEDFRSREISDWIPIALTSIACIAASFQLANIRWWMVITGASIGVFVGAALFQFANFGGGDAKLIAAIGSILGPAGLLIALFWMAIIGGLFATLAIVRGQRDYAYCIAIAMGYGTCLVYPINHFGNVVLGIRSFL